jgi:exonuclease SbcC
MRFNNLRLRNWEIHEHLDIEFQTGLIGIVGANGSGKSSILRALAFGLLGVVQGAGTKPDCIRNGSKSCGVDLEFSHGENSYSVRRTINPHKQELICPNGQRMTRQEEITREIEGVVETSAETMENNIFIAQGNIDNVLYSTENKRLSEFQETFGLGRSEEAFKSLGAEISRFVITPGLAGQIEDCQKQLDEAETQLIGYRKTIETLKFEISELAADEKRYKDYIDARKMIGAIQQADEQCAKYQVAVADIEIELKAKEADYATLHNVLVTIEQPASEARKTLSQLQSGKSRYNAYNSALARIAGLEGSLAKLPVPANDDFINDLYSKIVQLKGSITDLSDKISGKKPRPKLPDELALEAERDKLLQHERDLKLLGATPSTSEIELSATKQNLEQTLTKFKAGVCPTCHQKVPDADPTHLQAELSRLTSELTDLRNKRMQTYTDGMASLMTAKQRNTEALIQFDKVAKDTMAKYLAQLTDKLSNMQSEHSAAVEVKRVVNETVSQLSALKEQLPSLECDAPLDKAEEERLQNYLEQYDQLKVRLSNQNSAVLVAKQKLASVNDALSKARSFRTGLGVISDMPDEATFEALSESMKKLSARTQSLMSVKENVVLLEVKIEQYKSSLARFRIQLEREDADAHWTDICKKVRETLHVTGLPAMMMREYATVLNRRMAHYLSIWESDFRVYLDESLSFMAQFPDGRHHMAARLSGGQKIVASTSFRLAMADTFASKAGLLILDEPSNYLDEDNIVHLQRLLLCLKEHAGSTGRQILLVTHEKQFAGFFDQTIYINKKD